tara:strand:- start:42273 stop:42374 length:102 start_codon:yes stop_codon:yes gene_type:complete
MMKISKKHENQQSFYYTYQQQNKVLAFQARDPY